MSPVPVPNRSIYRVRYNDSANNGLCGTEACGFRKRANVNVEGSRPGFQISKRSVNGLLTIYRKYLKSNSKLKISLILCWHKIIRNPFTDNIF